MFAPTFGRGIADGAVGLDGSAFESLLDSVVADKRIVLLGESHHFVHETFALRMSILDHLARRGATVFGFEMAFGDAACADRYLVDGNPAWPNRIGTFGYGSALTRPAEGVLASTHDSFPAAAFGAEWVRLLDWFRHHPPPGGRWHLAGLDVDYDPAVAREQLDLDITISARGYLRDTIADSDRYDNAVRAAADYYSVRAPMAWREELMVRRAVHAIEAAPARGHIVLSGHNLHMTRGADRINIPGGVGPGGGLTPPLGCALAKRYPGQTCCIWTLHDHGTDSGPLPHGGAFQSTPRTLNAALARTGTAFALAARAHRALSRSWRIATSNGAVTRGLCDAIIFTAAATSLQP